MEKITKLYRKLTLANFLNWFGIKFYHKARFISYRIISIAIKLNPNREVFHKNINEIGLSPDGSIFFKKIKLPYNSVLEGCKNISSKIIFHKTGETIDLQLPKVINPDFKVSSEYACKTKLPDTYLVRIDNAQVFSGTDLIVVNKSILYDEIDKSDFDKYGIKSPIISKVSKDRITIEIPRKTKNIEQGIHFTKDHSRNYFHWIVECLSRLSLIDDIDSSVPLLVDSDLPSQLIESLKLLNSKNREIIILDRNISYKVNKLYYPSQLCVLHDNYKKQNYGKDVIFSPNAISFVKNEVLKKINNQEGLGCRKIYISRKNSGYRQLVNTVEIENLLVKMGFEIVFPEHLSFFSQAQLFSQAEIIVGQAGAGMGNFIFAPKGCKVIMLVGDSVGINLHCFSIVAELSNIDLKYIIGKSLGVPKIFECHQDFHVDIKLLMDYLNNEYSK